MSDRNPGIDHAIHAELGADPETAHLQRLREHNLVLPHNYRTPQNMERVCGHPGCENKYTFTLIPHQLVYPKFCPKHRSPWRRGQA
jgi:hypothetical protein